MLGDIMDNIKIDTDKVRETANLISSNNQKLDNEFKPVENAISYLENGWVSPAKDFCVSKFNKLKTTYIGSSSTSRYSSIEEYVRFLREYIGDVYDEVESDNTSLADAFK